MDKLTPSTLRCWRRQAGALAGLIALAGCGGGGSDPKPPIQINTAPRVVAASAGADVTVVNYTAQAAPMARVVLAATGNAALGTIGSGRESPLGAVSAAARPLAGVGLPIRIAVAQFARAAAREAPAATETLTSPCPISGSTTITATDANNNGKLDGGDSITIGFADCVLDAATPAANGVFSLQVLDSELDAFNGPTALSLTGSFAQLSVGTLARLDGAFCLKMTGCSANGDCSLMRLVYNDVTSIVGAESLTYRFDVLMAASAGSVAYELSGGVAWGGQVFALVPVPGQRITLTLADTVPSSGSLWLRDGGGDGLKLTAQPGGLVDFGFYTAGNDSTPTSSWLGRNWSSFF